MKKKIIIYYMIFFIIILIYLAVKSTNLEYGFSDENTYFYMGKLVAEGNLPYRDFFLSHPPLQVFFIGLIFKIFGFNFAILKLLPTLFIIIAAFFIFLIMRKFNGIYAILSVLFFLFSYDSLRFSTYNMGVNLALMFLIIGFFFFFNKKNYFFSGLFFGLGGLTRQIALIPFAVILIFLLIKNRKLFFKFLLGFSITFILPNLIFILAFGSKYIVPVFKYHFLKPTTGGEKKIAIFSRMIRVNWLLFLTAILFFIDKRKKQIGIVALISAIYILFLIALNKVFGYYFMILFPFLAILGGYSLINLIERIKINENLNRFSRLKLKILISKKILYSVLFTVVIIFSVFSVRNYINYDYQNFNNAEEIAGYIRLNSEENEEIFGDDSTTPLIALLSDRDIALDFADSNNLIFRSGIVDINKVIDDLKGVKFVIVYKENIGKITAIYGPMYMDEFSDYVKTCNLVKSFSDTWQDREKVIEIYDCEK